MSEAPVLGFIGLGVMGGGMSRNVVKKHPAATWAYDMNAEALRELGEAGAKVAGSVAEVAQNASIVFLSLPGGKQVAAVAEEIIANASPGTIVIDLSTTSVAEARAIAANLADKGFRFADAPVARTRQAAWDGTLSIMVGASEALFAQIEPLLRYMATDVTLCGEVGCGQVVKLINNTLVFEHVACLAELMVVAERAGVTGEKLVQAVSLGSGDSFVLRNHGLKAMVPREFPAKSFPSAYVLKDGGYSVELARQMGVEPKMATRALEYYQTAVDKGFADKYFPAIIELVEGK